MPSVGKTWNPTRRTSAEVYLEQCPRPPTSVFVSAAGSPTQPLPAEIRNNGHCRWLIRSDVSSGRWAVGAHKSSNFNQFRWWAINNAAAPRTKQNTASESNAANKAVFSQQVYLTFQAFVWFLFQLRKISPPFKWLIKQPIRTIDIKTEMTGNPMINVYIL